MTLTLVARCFVAFAFLMLGSASFAQTTSPPLPSVAAIQVGPVSVFPSINLHDIGFDSNIFNEAPQQRDDFTFTVTPRVQTAVRLGAARLAGVGSGDFVYYQTYKDQQSVNGMFDGRLELVSERLRPYVSAGRMRTRERTGFEIDARARRLETNITAGVDLNVTSITALTARVRRDDQTYGQAERFLGVNLGEQLDHTSELAAAGVKLALTPLTTITIAGEMQQDRFKASPLRNADSVRVAPAIEFAPDATLTGRASAGYRRFKPLDPRLPQYRGFVASAGVGYSLLGVTHFDVQANRDVTYSLDASQPYYLAFGGRVSVSQRLVGPFDLIVLGSRERLRYQPIGGMSLEGRVETTTSIGGGIGVHTGEHLSFALTYERTERQSREPDRRDYDRRRMLGSVNYGL